MTATPSDDRSVHEGPTGYKSAYMLRSDEKENSRLTLQHQAYKEVLGGQLVNPSISLPHNSHVLESGIGNGVWVLDFVNSYPNATIHGIDIQPGLFPRNLPRNISTSVCSITNLPHEWANTFDFVHQRLLVLALKEPEWHAALSEMFRVVKPGGWVQLEEAVVDYSTAGPISRKLAAIVNELAKSRGVMSYCAHSLPDFLGQAGFINVSIVRGEVNFGGWNGEISKARAPIIRDAYRGNGKPFVDAGLIGSLEEWDGLVDEAVKEWDVVTHPSGKGAHFPFIQFCAQKPL